MKIQEIPINQIKPNPDQPRKFINESKLKELAASIKNKRLLEEILIRPKDNYFEIVHGERRWRACKLLNWKTIKAKIEPLSDEEAFELSLIENIQRANLLPIEEAKAYKILADKGLTQKEIAERINKSRDYIAQKVRILKLPRTVQIFLQDGRLTEGHARQLLRLEKIIGKHLNKEKADPIFWFDGNEWFKDWIEKYQDFFACEIFHNNLTVNELKKHIDKFYFDVLSAIILASLAPTEEQEKEVLEIWKKSKNNEPLKGWEQDLYCRFFENGLRKKFGLSLDTITEEEFHSWSKYGKEHGILTHTDESDE